MYYDHSMCMYYDHCTCMYYDHSTCTYYDHSTMIIIHACNMICLRLRKSKYNIGCFRLESKIRFVLIVLIWHIFTAITEDTTKAAALRCYRLGVKETSYQIAQHLSCASVKLNRLSVAQNHESWHQREVQRPMLEQHCRLWHKQYWAVSTAEKRYAQPSIIVVIWSSLCHMPDKNCNL